MIGRLWHGWTARENAEAYQGLLVRDVLPGIERIDGYRGAYLLRRDVPQGVEFVTLTLFESMAAVRAFAGEDYTRAVIHGEAGKLLARFDERSEHYEVVLTPARTRS
jgi:heme-degrading monooxygenase HmoA